MNKKYCIFLTILFSLFIGGILVGSLLAPDQEFSELENRYLQTPPKLSLENLESGKFMEDAEDYVNDHVIGRDFWVALKAWSERLSGKQENNGVYFGKEDTLLNRLDEPDYDTLMTSAGYVNDLVYNLNVPVYFGIIPSSTEIWSDRLPAGAPTADEKTIIDDLYDTVQTFTIDMYSALEEHKDEEIYYRTDHHWTTLGAYYAYQQLCDALGMTPFDRDAHTARSIQDFYGTHYSKARTWNAQPDTLTWYDMDNPLTIYQVTAPGQPETGETTTLYAEDKLDTYDKYAMFLHGNNGLSHIEGDGEGRILVLKDSYANCFVPYLTANFAQIDIVDFRNYNYGLDALDADNHYDQVLVLYSFDSFKSDPYFYRAGIPG